MKILALQTDIAWEDRRTNFARIEALLADETAEDRAGCGGDGQELIVLPELATVGFSMNTAAVVEPRDGESARFFSDLARGRHSHLLAGLAAPGDRTGEGANEAVCFDPEGSEIGRYRKRRPFPLVREEAHYPAGVRPLVLGIGEWRVAPFICYDLRFPELFREAVTLGAEVLVVIANWPQTRIGHWTALLRARAIENLAYVVGVNRAGSDPDQCYPGASLVVGPQGEILAEAEAGPALLRAELDRESLLRWRRDFPALDGLCPPPRGEGR